MWTISQEFEIYVWVAPNSNIAEFKIEGRGSFHIFCFILLLERLNAPPPYPIPYNPFKRSYIITASSSPFKRSHTTSLF